MDSKMIKRENEQVRVARHNDENMLKNILLLQIKKGDVYVSELADILGMNLTTAYSGVARLIKNSYLEPIEARRGGRKSNKQSLHLTESGRQIADNVLQKYQIIMSWLLRLGLPEHIAKNEATNMQHGITDNIMNILRGHVEMVSSIRGKDDTKSYASEIMCGICSDSGRKNMNSGLLNMVANAGGVEGVARKNNIINRAGGEERINQILTMVEELGGYEELCRIKNDMVELEPCTNSIGGIKKLKSVIEVYNQFGMESGIKKAYKKAQMLEESKKNQKKLETELNKLRKMKSEIDEIGGDKRLKRMMKMYNEMENADEILELAYKQAVMWKKMV